MPPINLVRELKGAEVQAFTEAQLRELSLLYQESYANIRETVLSVNVTDFSRARGRQLERQVNQILRAIEEQSQEWATVVLPASYNRGVQVAERQLRRLKIARNVDIGSLIHTQAVSVLADQLAADLVTANGSIKREIGRYVRRAQVLRFQDLALTRSVAAGLIKGQARRDVSDAILRDLRASITRGDLIQVGKRRMRADTYSEIVARTRTREAVTEGTLNSAAEFGMDLVMIDTHDQPCAFCQQFSGRVFSVSGQHPDFPKLDRRPPFHPNCECTLHPTTQGHLKASGKYDKLKELSNDPSIPVMDSKDYEKLLGPAATAQSRAEKKIRKVAAAKKAAEAVSPKAPAYFQALVSGKRAKDHKKFFAKDSASHEMWRNSAGKSGLSTEGYIALVEQRLQGMVDKSRVAVRIRSRNLTSVLKDKRFKTQHETGTSGGSMATDARNKGETFWFNTPKNLPDNERPIYAFASNDGIGASVEQYGDVSVRLKSDIRERSTISFNDSLNWLSIKKYSPVELDDAKKQAMIPAPMTKVHSGAIPGNLDHLNSDFNAVDDFGMYAEVQVHGGISLDDIEDVVFTLDGPTDAQRALLEENNIPWRIMDRRTGLVTEP